MNLLGRKTCFMRITGAHVTWPAHMLIRKHCVTTAIQKHNVTHTHIHYSYRRSVHTFTTHTAESDGLRYHDIQSHGFTYYLWFISLLSVCVNRKASKWIRECKYGALRLNPVPVPFPPRLILRGLPGDRTRIFWPNS